MLERRGRTLPLRAPVSRQNRRQDLHNDATVLWPDPGRDTLTPAHARLSPGWQARQHRVGGPALFTPSAARTGLFKQSRCLHKLPLCLWTSSGRRVLMWPFPRASWTVYSREREKEREMLPAVGLRPQHPSSQLFDQITVGQKYGGTASKYWHNISGSTD